jgi:hypothetical protein
MSVVKRFLKKLLKLLSNPLQAIMGFLHEHKTISGILYLITFLASGWISYLFNISSAMTKDDYYVGVVLTLGFEFGKAIFSICSILPYFTKWQRTVFVFLWIVSTGFSIYCTVGYYINTTNRIENTLVENSPEYKQLLDKEKRLKLQRDEKQKELDLINNSVQQAIDADRIEHDNNTALIKEYNTNLVTLQRKLDIQNNELQYCINRESQNKPMTNTKAKVQNEIKNLKDQIKSTTEARDALVNSNKTALVQKNIEGLKNELKTLDQEINNIDYGTIHVDAKKADRGSLSIHLLVASLLHVNTGTYILLFNIFIATIFEIMINQFYKISFVSSRIDYKDAGGDNKKVGFNTNDHSPTPFIVTKDKNEVVNKIGFNFEDISSKKPKQLLTLSSKTLDFRPTVTHTLPKGAGILKDKNADKLLCGTNSYHSEQTMTHTLPKGVKINKIKKYLEVMYDNMVNNNQSPGQNIFRNNGFKDNEVRGIRYYLSNLGIIEVDAKSKKTIVLVREHRDALNIVNKNYKKIKSNP